MDWDMPQPNRIIDEKGGEWAIGGSDLFAFGAMVANRREELVWQQAASGYLGTGLDLGGPDLTPVEQTGKHYDQQGPSGRGPRAMLDVVVTGGCWFKDRRHSAFPQEVTTPLCPRCEMEPQIEAHAYWTCICLQKSELPEVIDTQH